MPFTFAHPAAAVPLQRYLARFGVLSGLVIGSLTPDLAYFLSWRLPRTVTHSLSGLFWFCMPAGIALYVLFHLVLKGPLLGLLPPAVLSRLSAHTSRFNSLPPVSWVTVLVSLFCGAVSHLVWDSFTHADGIAVMALPILDVELFTVFGYRIHAYSLLQHGSSVGGLAVLAVWSWRWLEKQPARAAPLPVAFSPASRIAVAAAIVAASAVSGLSAGAHAIGSRTDFAASRLFVNRTVFTALPVFALAVLVYGVGWHLWRVRAERRTAKAA